jgi:hypothetical protein
MSEWLKEHAWKAISYTLTERHRNTSWRNRFSDLALQDAARCDSLDLSIRRRFRANLTQFLHNLQADLSRWRASSSGATSVYSELLALWKDADRKILFVNDARAKYRRLRD